MPAGEGGAAGVADVAQALTQHDRVRRSTDIPLFYANKTKDTISAQQLIDRIETAAKVAKWDDARKVDEFYLCLRSDAISWWNTLENILDFKRSWDNIKDEFLEAYDTKYSAKTLCVCLQDLKQLGGETVQAYYNRVSDAFRNAFRVLPEKLKTAECEDGHDGSLKEGVQKMKLHIMVTIFLGGLKEDIRTPTLDAEPETLAEAVAEARKQEVLVRDRRMSHNRGVVVASVTADDAGDDNEGQTDNEIIEVTEEEANQMLAVDAIVRRRGGRPLPAFRIRRDGARPNFPQSNTANMGNNGHLHVLCYFCNKRGHVQRDCRAKKRAEASGKGRGNVSAVEKQEPALNW